MYTNVLYIKKDDRSKLYKLMDDESYITIDVISSVRTYSDSIKVNKDDLIPAYKKNDYAISETGEVVHVTDVTEDGLEYKLKDGTLDSIQFGNGIVPSDDMVICRILGEDPILNYLINAADELGILIISKIETGEILLATVEGDIYNVSDYPDLNFKNRLYNNLTPEQCFIVYEIERSESYPMDKIHALQINGEIDRCNEEYPNFNTDDISDTYHTFGELYHHRSILFAVLISKYSDIAFKSRHHHDGTMFKGMFIAGVKTPDGDYTYHFENKYWDAVMVPEYDKAPPYDGHIPDDVIRLFSLLSV